MILEEKTYSEFGYYSTQLSRWSHKPIWVQCPICGMEKYTKRWLVTDSWMCMPCCSRGHAKERSAERKIYQSRKEKQYAYQKRLLSTPLGIATHRLRVLLRRAVRVNGFCLTKGFSNLGYTSIQLLKHIEHEKIKGCAICGLPIEDIWHIAHKIPSSKAIIQEELLELFALENLTVAHPRCNQQLGAKVIG